MSTVKAAIQDEIEDDPDPVGIQSVVDTNSKFESIEGYPSENSNLA